MLCSLYRCIKEGWGACINEGTVRGTWSLSRKQVAYQLPKTQAVFLALKRVPRPLQKIVFVETVNATVVSYINKEGGMSSGPLGALLWRILTWCTRNQVTPKALYIPGLLSLVADKQTIWARPDHLNSGLSFKRSSKQYMQQVASASNRPIGHRLNNKSPLCLRHQIP